MIKNIKKILAALIIITIAVKSMAFLPDSVLDGSSVLTCANIPVFNTPICTP